MLSRYRRHFLFLVFVLLATPLVAGLLMPEKEQEILKEKRNRTPAPTVPHGLYDLAALPKGWTTICVIVSVCVNK
jgi:hypothetical protein